MLILNILMSEATNIFKLSSEQQDTNFLLKGLLGKAFADRGFLKFDRHD